MALPTAWDSDTEVAVREHIWPSVINDWFYEDAFLLKLRANKNLKQQAGGTKIVHPIEYREVISAWTPKSDGDTGPTPENRNTLTAAEFTWKCYPANFGFTVFDDNKAQGAYQTFNLLANKIKSVGSGLGKALATNLYDKQGVSAQAETGFITGIQLAVDASDPGTSFDYGGIDRANTWWRSSENTTTTTFVSKQLIKDIDPITKWGTPDILILNSTGMAEFYGMAQSEKLNTNPAQNDLLYRLGYSEMSLHAGGPPISVVKSRYLEDYDSANSTTTSFCGDTKFFYMYQSPKYSGQIQAVGKKEEDPLYASIWHVVWMGGVICSNPQAWIKWTALTA